MNFSFGKGSNLNFSNKNRSASASINITSLMAILTIIVIFLLVNYSDVVEDTDLPKFIEPPIVKVDPDQMKSASKQSIQMVVGANRIDINSETIRFASFDDEKEAILERTTSILEKYRQDDEKEGKETGIAFHADQRIPYSTIDELLVSSAAAGITQFSFMALQEGK